MILSRIAQEALTNARKHSQAARVEVILRHQNEGILMTITDDGVGFTPQQAGVAAAGHLGLVAMRERAEMAGGRCDLHSLPGAGASVEVWLPFEMAPPEPDADPTGEGWDSDVEQLLVGQSDAPKQPSGIA